MSILMDRMNRGECDASLVVPPFMPKYPDMCHRFLRSYPVMAVLSSDHPLARREKLSYSDLKGEPFIMMEPSDRPRDRMEEALLIYKRGGFLPDIAAMESEPETLLLMISAGMGISILPEYIIRPYVKDRDLAVLPLVTDGGIAETVDFSVMWKENNINPALQSFLSVLTQ